MKTIMLSPQEFQDFKRYFRQKFDSTVKKGYIYVSANESQLALFGW